MHIEINRQSKIPLIRQLYKGIRDSVLEGRLTAEFRLPSSRQLASELDVSRVVVIEAYEQLVAEGYLQTKIGAGTYVANIKPYRVEKKTFFEPLSKSSTQKSGLANEGCVYEVDFRTGAPDLSLFPVEKWGYLYKQVCQEISSHALDYYDASGSYQLRRALTEYLGRTRGIVTKAENLVITTGAAQAFTLLSRLLVEEGKRVVVEDPINKDINSMLLQTGGDIQAVPVDAYGIQTRLIKKDQSPSLVFTTPSHQFPMGGILSIDRRLSLIECVKKGEGYIIEDDYDSAFRYNGNPVSALHTLAPDKVIYTGTFSKILFPALRIGYVILPDQLVDDFMDLKHLEDLHTPILEQLTLAKFIDEGYLDRHIYRCKRVYKKKNLLLQKVLVDTFGNKVKILGDSAGIHLVAEFQGYSFESEDFEAMELLGLHINPITPHTRYPEEHKHHLMLGYGHLTLNEISEGVKLLQRYMNNKQE